MALAAGAAKAQNFNYQIVFPDSLYDFEVWAASSAPQYGYFVVIGLILAGCVGLYVMFRRNGWL